MEKEFGEKIKKLREEKGMTQQSLADQLYVTRQAVSRYESGARYPDLMTTKKIADILGTSVDVLLSGEEMSVVVERQPIVNAYEEKRMETALYALASVFCLLVCGISALKLIQNWNLYITINQNGILKKDYSIPDKIVYLLDFIKYAGMTILLWYSTWMSVKQEITPKIAGMLGVICFGCDALQGGIEEIFHGFWFFNIPFIIPVFQAMFAIVLGRFFLGSKNRSPKWVYILSAFVLGCRGIWESGKLWLETTGGRWNGEFFRTGLYFVLYDLLLLSLVIVFVFQARILSKKRKCAVSCIPVVDTKI